MTIIDTVIIIYLLLLAAFVIRYVIGTALEINYHEMLVSAIFRYRTQCYMTGVEPGFDLDCIGRMPWWSLRWKHMIPEEIYEEIKPIMDELKNDPRF